MSIFITGATGELGGLVIEHLLKKVSANQIVAVVRNMDKASALADLGIEVRHGDYLNPESLQKAFAGADKLLFISSPDSDDTLRIVQHANVVKAARDAGVKHIAYTSFAFAKESNIPLAQVHLATEHAIRTTKIPYTFLGNSLYTEVFVNPGLGASLEHGAIVTNTGTGKLNTATRSDLALAAAAVLTGEGHENKTYNLVSGQTWTYDELASIVSEVSGKQIVHKAVSFEEEKNILLGAGFPEPVANLFAGIYHAVSVGETSKTSNDLLDLIGSTTPLKETVKQVLQG
ncbi:MULTISPECIES: SDR family oxidoreductase [unclassified Paenibacillus]|uniref:SDR family oxidoreductase n=1 Tax=unclassified Paenibacillus TaxID=185978 RepID=UPI001AE91BEB|nr:MULTISPECIES: SDR family oxidoreductase [unclassified Paenibacillus]MBP1157221.1 NAD(P)H dehydrogenase (quinone) [Paenibacillus sp. PvP091]MBP1172040.1 NAD(P)H dehydrogenase (quinone) [Paenibacillus sp. PvR098]MBP2438421.1 NAD(P)H dehydrogenase (quinone) [Paenibacillus sp. PvP052]